MDLSFASEVNTSYQEDEATAWHQHTRGHLIIWTAGSQPDSWNKDCEPWGTQAAKRHLATHNWGNKEVSALCIYEQWISNQMGWWRWEVAVGEKTALDKAWSLLKLHIASETYYIFVSFVIIFCFYYLCLISPKPLVLINLLLLYYKFISVLLIIKRGVHP